jgi:S1-C subfamily serine protease
VIFSRGNDRGAAQGRYSAIQVRLSAVAAISLVSAVLGAAAVLLAADAGGWLGASKSRTVVITEPSPVGASASVRTSDATPLSGSGFVPARIYAKRSAGVVTIYAFFSATGPGAAQGSGFVVSDDGYILTNSHVITSAGDSGVGSSTEAAREVYVEFKDHDRVRARIIGWDVFDDVGLLKVEPKAHALTPVPLGDSSRVRVGEPVAAIGSPFGNENSLAVGVVSAVHRSIRSLTSSYNLTDAIQTDAPINHGNSGGPLFDARGRVIGINAQIRSDSGNAEGVGFAVPINSARRSMAQLIATGRVAYAYVGITTEDLTPSLARRFKYPALHGAVIDTVRPGTAGDRAGLRGGSREVNVNGSTFTTGGDLIVGIAGRSVRTAEDLVRVVTQQLHPGQTAMFTLFREGRRLRLPVKLDERPDTPESGR